MTAEERILDAGYEDVIIFGTHGSGDSFDDALVGMSSDGRAIYDFDLMVKWLMDNDGMTAEDAIEWIEYNTIRSLPYVGAGAPIVMYSLE
jgi:hypothetical protein